MHTVQTCYITYGVPVKLFSLAFSYTPQKQIKMRMLYGVIIFETVQEIINGSYRFPPLNFIEYVFHR